MTTPEKAEEHLRVIRGLMERATIYRAISAPMALVGGVLSLIATVMTIALGAIRSESIYSIYFFIPVWITILFVTLLFNTCSLYNSAKKRGEPFLSSGLKLAIRVSLPSYLTAAVLTAILFLLFSQPVFVFVIVWILFHGLGLLATQTFAPKSIFYLGLAFLFTGLIYLVTFCLLAVFKCDVFLVLLSNTFATILMGVTFGAYHLIYAFFTWPRKEKIESTLPEIIESEPDA